MFGKFRRLCVLLSFVATISFATAERLPAIHSLPITFEPNQGQAPVQYGYVFHRDGLSAMFFRNGIDFDFTGTQGRVSRIQLTLVGGDADPKAQGALGGHSNYFIGSDSSRWIRNVPLSKEIEYSELYPGISLSFYGNGRELEHDFRVSPGADPARIAIRLEGTDPARLTADGDLEINSGDAVLTLRKPVAYQEFASGRRAVVARFLLAKDGTVRFGLGEYDNKLPLVIDPVFVFSTYLGGTGTDVATAVTTDANGNIFLTGYTNSTDFPTSHPEQAAMGGCSLASCGNVFISKFDPAGTTLIYSTYLGGSNQDFGDGIAVDGNGNAIVAGYVNSSNFPHAGAITAPSSCSGTTCYFLASLSPDGSMLNYSGAVGGRSVGGPPNLTNTPALPLAVDRSGNAYLASVTYDAQFQITPGTLASSVEGYPYSQMFVLKVGPVGEIVYSTVVPGNASYDPSESYINLFVPAGISVDASGSVTTVGQAGVGLPTSAGAVTPQFPNDPTAVNASAGYVLQLNTTASAIDFASYLPGTDQAGGMAVDKNGNLWIVGTTRETNLPVSQNAYMKAPTVGTYVAVSTTGYILELSPGAKQVLGATYLDGTGVGQIWESSQFTAVALDSRSNVFVGGVTSSADFPMQNPFVSEYETGSTVLNLILAEMSPDLSTLEFGSFLSSTDTVDDQGTSSSAFAGLAIDGSDNLIVAGDTWSRHFPITAGSFEPQLPAQANASLTPQHIFVTKIDMATPAPAVCMDWFNFDFGSVAVNIPYSATLQVRNCGNAALNIYSATSIDPEMVASENCGAIAPGGVCAVTLTFTPRTTGSISGWVNLGDNADTLPQSVYFSAYAVGSPNNPLPVITGMSPPFTSMGGGGSQLTVHGVGFTTGSTVYWGSTALSTQLVSATQLTAETTSSNLGKAGVAEITVQNPSPGGGSSNKWQYEVDSAGAGVKPPYFETATATVTPGTATTFGVTLPSAATNVSARCLNLPSGATCGYSSGTVTINTSTSTPAGTYQITVVFTEALPSGGSAAMVLPIFMLPLAFARRKWAKRAWLAACLGLALTIAAAVGCGGSSGGSGGGTSPSQPDQVTSSGVVSITVM
jgi:hypothetical protein